MDASGFIETYNTTSNQSVVIATSKMSIISRIRYENKFMVLKELKPEFIGSPIQTESLFREFQIGFQLNHPNIIQYHSFTQDINCPKIMMEYVDGENLARAIHSSGFNLSEKSVLRLLTQLVDVIQYLHEQQIYHLDIKPENLLITRRGKNLKVIDFGHTSSDAYNKKWGGTKEYQLSSDPNQFGAHEDFFAFGQVVRFLLANKVLKSSRRLRRLVSVCVDSSENKHPDYQFLRSLTETPNHKNKIIMTGIATTLIVLTSLTLYKVMDTSPAKSVKQANQTVNSSVDSSRFHEKPETNSESISKVITPEPTKKYIFNNDSLTIVALVNKYTKKVESLDDKLKKLTMSERLDLLSEVADQTAKEWYELSKKWKEGTIEYEKATILFTEIFSKEQMRFATIYL